MNPDEACVMPALRGDMVMTQKLISTSGARRIKTEVLFAIRKNIESHWEKFST